MANYSEKQFRRGLSHWNFEPKQWNALSCLRHCSGANKWMTLKYAENVTTVCDVKGSKRIKCWQNEIIVKSKDCSWNEEMMNGLIAKLFFFLVIFFSRQEFIHIKCIQLNVDLKVNNVFDPNTYICSISLFVYHSLETLKWMWIDSPHQRYDLFIVNRSVNN